MTRSNGAAKGDEILASKASDADVSTFGFVRNGCLYHGRVKELADAARKGGLKF